MNIILDNGTNFGWGTFETIAIKNSQPEFWDYHLERLALAMKFLGLNHSLTTIEKLTQNYLQTNELQEVAFKLLVTPENILCSHRENPYVKLPDNTAFRLQIASVLRNESSPLIFHKTLNYGDNYYLRQRAKSQGYDEAILLNTQGFITEGTATNIFFTRQNKFYTPAVANGLLPGIMRRYICETFNVEETNISLEDLAHFDKCYISNSLMGCRPVQSLGDIEFDIGDRIY